MAIDPQILQHRDWLGLLQPVGLVVSPVALVKAQAVIDRNRAVVLQPILQGLVSGDVACVADFAEFAQQVLGWLPEDLVTDLPDSLSWGLTEYEEVLCPSFGVRDPDSGEWILLVQEVAIGLDLDATVKEDAWRATSEEKFERLLREVKVSAGILWNGEVLRLVYAPRGESSGYVTFPIAAMTEVAGRSILAALDAVLGGDRLFNVPSDRRLSQILINSRAYQSEVSEKLADQVVDALWALLKGFQMADAATNGTLLKELDAAHLYGGLITTLMRLVFLLYAEDEGLMPNDSVYQRHYAVTGLYEQLREDAGNYPDTMDDRYGAWAGLLSLFGLVYEGGGATEEYLPARHGQLFDPREFAFLAGFGTMPRIPDGVIYRVLDKLLMLDGERLSYRSLDVEQIGSVYEGIMGYTVERSASLSIGVNSKPKGSKVSTTVVVDVDALLREKGTDRSKRLKEWANCELAAGAAKLVKEAKTIEELVAGLGGRVSRRTPDLLTIGALYLQPTEERRRSGSHYTPRALTAPIVETTLQPVLAQLGEMPTAEQILNLKVCDLAMGSGAFLVEVCRQLAEKLVEAWGREGADMAGEEPLLLARRLIAQRCLYGVDKNPFAMNLAKLSLWLVTLSKDAPFTFLDHALKCGDSLVGLSRKEIFNFGQESIQDLPLIKLEQDQLLMASRIRVQIQSSDTKSDADAAMKVQQLREAEAQLFKVRIKGDVAISAFFDSCGRSKKERERLLFEYEALVRQQSDRIIEISDRLKNREKPIIPFNWEIEFPEVFDNGGFDAIVGNPPFVGGYRISSNYGDEYLAWIKEEYTGSGGQSDLVAYFFRRAFMLLKQGGTFGLIATNTIAQGDTRTTGLQFICQNGGTIYHAQTRLKWPGLAAVVVSAIQISKSHWEDSRFLDEVNVSSISAFLFPNDKHDNPKPLLENSRKSFKGSMVYGMGFTFDDTNVNATLIETMHKLISKDSRNAERIFPYIGGEEVNSSPAHSHHRYVINFGELTEGEARKYPDLMAIVEEKVYPERRNKPGSYSKQWWLFGRPSPALFRAIAQCDRVLVVARHSPQWSVAFMRTGMVFSEALVVIALDANPAFAILQSRIHEIWARFFGSSMKDDLRYTPSDCFETFPFPENWETDPTLEAAGEAYYTYRAQLMVTHNQGLTTTYNRFHDPEETDPTILHLRDLHSKIDEAVLTAHGWPDIDTTCEFILDYEDEEDTTSKRKKPYRYRWTQATHDEVLARLLDLNQKRYDKEMIGGKKVEKGGKKKREEGKKNAKTPKSQPSIPEADRQLALIPEPIEQLDVWSTINESET